MWEALPVADKEVTVDVDPLPPSDGAPTVAASSDAPPTRLEDLKFVEDGRMTLKEFIVWMDLVTHSFTKEAHDHLITNLKAILKKEKLYYQVRPHAHAPTRPRLRAHAPTRPLVFAPWDGCCLCTALPDVGLRQVWQPRLLRAHEGRHLLQGALRSRGAAPQGA